MAENSSHNVEVNKFRSKVLRGLKSSAASLSGGKTKSYVIRKRNGMPDQTEKKLANSIFAKTRMDGDMIESVSFSFERHGIFVMKGVSRKHGKGNPRVVKDWIGPVIDPESTKLADIIAEITADKIVVKLKNS